MSRTQKGSSCVTSKEAAIFQLKRLKGKSFKQKVEHIFTYFRTPILLVLLILIIGVSYVVHLATSKDSVLSVICLNSFAEADDADSYGLEFAQAAGIDTNKYDVQITTEMFVSKESLNGSYETSQVIFAQAASQSIDILAADLDTLTSYFYQDYFVDLRQILSLEQQEHLHNYFLYVDTAYLDQISNMDDLSPTYPDPTKPEEMSQPIPVGLLLPPDSSFTQLCYSIPGTQPSIGILINSKNLDTVLSFLDYIGY